MGSCVVWPFFCFMRVAEFTVRNAGEFDSQVHLTPHDISVDSPEEPTLLVRIKASKTDQFLAGTSIFLAAAGTELCPVSAVLCYLAERPNGEGPIFLLGSGEPLTGGGGGGGEMFVGEFSLLGD